MRVCVVSAFRDSSHDHVDNWFGQVGDLARTAPSMYGEFYGPVEVCAVAVEGDSVNDTSEYLRSRASGAPFRLDVVEVDTGAPRYGSTEQPERMAALSIVGNAMLAASAERGDVVVYVESDLIWDSRTIWHLIGKLGDSGVVAPLVFAGENFYDVWAFRGLDGSRFAPFFPYHSSIVWERPEYPAPPLNNVDQVALGPIPLVEVSSVGSCLVMTRRVAATCSIKNGGALVDFCADVRANGNKINVDPSQRIYHP